MPSLSKMPNALLNGAGHLATQDDGIVANLAAGAQYGFTPHLAQLDASTALVLRPVTYIVTHVPGMFKYVPGYVQFTKTFFEQIAHNISGVTIQYRNEGHGMPAMSDGQQAYVPTDTKRTAVEPTVNTAEYTGNVCWNYIATWIRMKKDPDTQAASLVGYIDPNEDLPPHTFSVFSMDMAGIQYDTTLRPKNIIDGFQLTAMHPNDTGDAEFQHEIGTSHSPERSFTFNAVLQHNRNTAAAARTLAETMELHKVNANFQTPVATDVESLIANYGIKGETSTDAANYTPLGNNAATVG